MYQLDEDMIKRLIVASKKLQASMVASPMWVLLKTEPAIVEFVDSLAELEQQVPNVSS